MEMDLKISCDDAYLMCMALRIYSMEQSKLGTLLSISEDDTSLLAHHDKQAVAATDLFEKVKTALGQHHEATAAAGAKKRPQRTEEGGAVFQFPRGIRPSEKTGWMNKVREQISKLLGPDVDVAVTTIDPETAKEMIERMEKNKQAEMKDGEVVIPSKDTLPN